ncbi:hypothetical protein Tco_0347699 [Tanacetum coccineum]
MKTDRIGKPRATLHGRKVKRIDGGKHGRREMNCLMENMFILTKRMAIHLGICMNIPRIIPIESYLLASVGDSFEYEDDSIESEEPKTSKNQGFEPTTEPHEGVQIKLIPPKVGPIIEENVPLIGLKRRCDIFFADPIDGREDEYVWLEAINTPDDLHMRQGNFEELVLEISIVDVHAEAKPETGLKENEGKEFECAGHLNQFKKRLMAPPIDIVCDRKDQPKQEMTLLEQLLLQSIEGPMFAQKQMEVYKKVGQILHKLLDINNKSKHEFKISNFTM